MSSAQARPDAAERVVSALDDLGVEIGMLVSNAGFGTYGPLVDQDPAPRLRLEPAPLGLDASRIPTAPITVGLVARPVKLDRRDRPRE